MKAKNRVRGFWDVAALLIMLAGMAVGLCAWCYAPQRAPQNESGTPTWSYSLQK